MKRNLIVLLSLALGATAVCADDAERHGSKMMNANQIFASVPGMSDVSRDEKATPHARALII